MRRLLGWSLLCAVLAAGCSSAKVEPVPGVPDSGEPGGGWQIGDGGGVTGQDSGQPPEDGGDTQDAGAGTDAGPPDAGQIIPVIRFVAIGDTGTGSQGQFDVAAAIKSHCAQAGCDFVVMLGDNIYDTGVSGVDDPQFQTKFEVPYDGIDLPFYVVLGNHDYGGDGVGNEFSKGQHQVDYTQHSTRWVMPAAYYRFTKEHVEFFAMDTNMQMYGIDSQQEKDVAAWLAASTAQWKVMLGHHPYLSNGKHGNAGNYDGVPFVPIANGAGVKSFSEKIWCGKADLYLCGHDHSRQDLSATCQGTQLMVSGTGAKVTTLPGSNAKHFQAATLGFVWIEIAGPKLTTQFVDVNGTVEHTRTFTK